MSAVGAWHECSGGVVWVWHGHGMSAACTHGAGKIAQLLTRVYLLVRNCYKVKYLSLS